MREFRTYMKKNIFANFKILMVEHVYVSVKKELCS